MSLHEARKGQVLVNPKGSRSETLAFDLVERLGEVKEVGYQIQHLGAYFAFLPSRVGHNAGLDAALRCFLSAHRNLLRKESAHVRECEVQDYNQALRLIRQDIEVARDKTPSETVCAAMILASYEVGIPAQNSACCLLMTGSSSGQTTNINGSLMRVARQR